jgi:type I restriction enzyme S subunit
VREKDLLQERDILFVRSNGNRDLIGRTLYIAELSERITHSAFTIRARLTTEGTLPRFYAYLLRSEAIRQSLSAFGGGTNISNLNQQILDQLSVPFPPIQIQRKIVAILSAYDDLIENNLRRIKILEEMVQNIYREWFVKFHFPGYEKAKMIDSSLGMIPKGWEVVTVEEIVKRLPAGKLYDHNTVFRDGLVPVLDQGKSGIIGYHNDNPSVQANEEDPVIVFANHTCYQRIIQFPFSAIQNVLPFLPNPKCYRDIYWLHWATKDLISLNDYKGHWPEFMSKQLFLPQDELCLLFGQFAKPIVRECYKLDTINANLQQTRDLLLSKLISGEIDISDLDIKIEEIA